MERTKVSKVLTKAFAYFTAFVLVFSSVLLSGNHSVKAAKMKINHSAATLCINESTTLRIGGSSRGIRWTTSNPNVAKVNAKGKVTGKSIGSATITGTYRGKDYKCKVTVIRTLKVDKTEYTIKDSAPLDLKVAYNAKKDSEIMYSISNPDVVTCEWDGEWNNKKTHLYITPTDNGQTTVEIANSINDEVLVINIDVVDFDPSYYDGVDDDDDDDDDDEGYDGSNSNYDEDEDDDDEDW